MLTQREYIENLANTLTKTTLNELFIYIHANYYPNQDISFMNYFLELLALDKNVPSIKHDKLIEYGIMTSSRSSAIVDRLIALGLIENEDFRVLQDVLQNSNGAGRPAKLYLLTPNSFKLCLMRAQRRANQPVDPTIYANYYLLLEEIYKLYTDYERLYAAKLLSIKNTDIKELKETVDNQTNKIDELLERSAILMGFANQAAADRDDLKVTLEDTKEELTGKLDIAVSYLKEKSRTSTKNPKKPKDVHYVCVMKKKTGIITHVQFLSGKQSHIDNQIKKKIKTGMTVAIPKFYNANGIDLRNNSKPAFVKYRKELVDDYNANLTKLDDIHNAALKAEIKQFNIGKAKENKRLYSSEKRTTNKLSIGSIPIKWNIASFNYTTNDYITFDEALAIIVDVNKDTQKSPLSSDADTSDSE